MPDPKLSELIQDVREHLLYMQELGVERLSASLPEPKVLKQSDEKVEVRERVEIPTIKRNDTPVRKAGSRLAAMPSLSKRANGNTGARSLTETASDKDTDSTKMASDNETQLSSKGQAETLYGDISPKLEVTEDTIESIRAEIGNCIRCPLHAQGRKQIVHTTGNFNADLMFIGEAPGADEDEQGFPFVGRAGQLLTKIIESIGLKREEVCIGNINRCRPPENRKPEPVETEACRPFILREIAVVKPKVVVVLGATAAHNLLQVKTPISKLRGHFHDYFGVKVMPTFHPAYLLRDPHKKKDVWEDMKKVRALLKSVVE
ncbi:MAG TPA: uracil-DNA glycosylase [Pyrinomonadaceae bacterium]|nr:uracil-DNA glycosylase [Pyrinomonadaceae bacterium]HMP65153.1 uracil-DNA glycosylase [Pyrinomonadaceae bacterium]